MTQIHVIFALTGRVANNSRALRQLTVLENLTDRVSVITFDAVDAPNDTFEKISWIDLKRPPQGGVRFFWGVHRNLSELLSRLEPASVLHASDLYVLPAMSAAARRMGARLVYDARELYPHVAGTVGRPWATLFWSRLENLFVARADLVMTVNETIADRMSRAYGIERPVVLYNVPDHGIQDRTSRLRDRLELPRDTKIVLHQGVLKSGRGVDVLIEAMRYVEGARLVLLGDGPERDALRVLVGQLGLSEVVHFLDPVPYRELLGWTASADIGVTLLQDTCLNHRFALPNKLFEYLAARVPVLGSDFPEISRVIDTFDVGMTVDPSQPEVVGKTLQQMLSDDGALSRWRSNAPRVFDEYNWNQAARRMEEAYRSL